MRRSCVKLFCGFQIAAERFFENEPAPVAVLFLSHSVFDDLLRDVREQVRRRRHIIEIVLRYLVLRADIGRQFLYVAEKLLIVVKIAARVICSVFEPFKKRFVGLMRAEFLQILDHLPPEIAAFKLLPADADDSEIVRQKPPFARLYRAGKSFRVCEIAGRAEDDHHARIGTFLYIAHKYFHHRGTAGHKENI